MPTEEVSVIALCRNVLGSSGACYARDLASAGRKRKGELEIREVQNCRHRGVPEGHKAQASVQYDVMASVVQIPNVA